MCIIGKEEEEENSKLENSWFELDMLFNNNR